MLIFNSDNSLDKVIKQSTSSSFSIKEKILHLTRLLVELHKNNQYANIMHPKNIKQVQNKLLFHRQQLTKNEEAYYTAPENFHMFKRNKNEQSDLYSLGVLIYYLYADRYPISLGENQTWIEAHLTNTIEPIQHLDAKLNAIILKLLEKNPQKRYKSALGLYYELQQVYSEQDIHSIPFIVGEIDDQLNAINNLTFPLKKESYEIFQQFVQQDSTLSSFLSLVGQSQTLRVDTVTQLVSLIDKSKAQIYYIHTFIEEQDEQWLINNLINQYVNSLSSLPSQRLQDFFAKLTKLNLVWLVELSKNNPSLEKIMIRYGVIDAIQVFNVVDSNTSNSLENKEKHMQLLHLIHSFLEEPVYWIVAGERELNDEEFFQLIAIYDKLGSHIKLIISHSDRTNGLVPSSSTKIILASLEYEEVRLLLNTIMIEDTEHLRILAQSLLFISKGSMSKLKAQLLQWQKAKLIYFNVETYRWSWHKQLIENQTYTYDLVTSIKQKVMKLSDLARQVLSVAAFIDTRVNALLLAEVCAESTMDVFESMKQAEQLGVVFYDKKDVTDQFELSEYVFLNDEIRLYLQQQIVDDLINWHYKIGTVVYEKFSYSINNSTKLYMKHFNAAHTLLSDDNLELLVQKNLHLCREYLIESNVYNEARYYANSGKQLCDYYGGKYKKLYYQFLLYLATAEYVCNNPKQATQYFRELEPYIDQLNLEDRRYYFIWQMEIYAFENEELSYKYSIAALELFEIRVDSRVNLITLLKEIIKTQQLLKKYRSGDLPVRNNNAEQFRLLCRTIYSASSSAAGKNPFGLIYLYTQFIQNNLYDGMNKEFAHLISMYELMIHRGAPQLFRLFPSNTYEFILTKENYESYHFYVVKAIISQMEKREEVYPFLTLAMSQALKVADYRNVNLVLLILIVMFNEEISKMKSILTFIHDNIDLNTDIDINLKELIDEFIYYYEANQSEPNLFEYINLKYDSSKRHINYISMNKMEMSYLAHQYEHVLFWYENAAKTMIEINWLQNRKILLYRHLAWIGLFYQSDEKKLKKEYVKRVKSFIKKMKTWKGYYGFNTSIYFIVCGQYEEMLGKFVNAQTSLEKAIRLAKEEKDYRFEGLALESLARLFTRLGSETGRMITLMDAITAYTAYGIQSKVDMLRADVKTVTLLHNEGEEIEEEHHVNELAVNQSVEVVISDGEQHLSDMYNIKGHWSNQAFLDEFLTLACRQVTAEFGLLVKIENDNITVLTQYGNTQFTPVVNDLEEALNYCSNTLHTYIYNNNQRQCWRMDLNANDIQALICIPYKMINRQDMYILVIGSHYFDQLFTQQEELVLELLLSRFMYLVEQSQVSSKQVTSYLQTSVEATVFTTLMDPLTERELEVLRRISGGLSNDEICKELNIKIATVKTHINNIYSKLGVKRRAQAILKAKEMKLV